MGHPMGGDDQRAWGAKWINAGFAALEPMVAAHGAGFCVRRYADTRRLLPDPADLVLESLCRGSGPLPGPARGLCGRAEKHPAFTWLRTAGAAAGRGACLAPVSFQTAHPDARRDPGRRLGQGCALACEAGERRQALQMRTQSHANRREFADRVVDPSVLSGSLRRSRVFEALACGALAIQGDLRPCNRLCLAPAFAEKSGFGWGQPLPRPAREPPTLFPRRHPPR